MQRGVQGRIQDFKIGGGGGGGGGSALKKIAPSGRRHENVWGILCEKSRFYAKKSYFPPPPPRIRPWCFPTIKPFNTETHSCLKDRNNNKGQWTFQDISFEGHVTIDIGTDIFICFAIQQ